MTEPITTNRSFIVPNTGDLSGAWGTSALNPNFQSIDTLFGGVTTISLSSATTILLSVPATTGVWPGGNPSQSMNAVIRFTGAQTGSATIQFTLPGFYIMDNQCTGTTSVRLQPSNLTGNCIGAIPGKKHQVFYDGVHMDFCNMADPGTAYDLHTNTTTLPPWMTACTVSPYLIKDGTVYNVSSYPALSQLLGSTYGGNGATTFGVPDERNRMRLPVNTGTASSTRVTNAISGINGTTFGAAGGSEALQSHVHSVTDPGHVHGLNQLKFSQTNIGTGSNLNAYLPTGTNSSGLQTDSVVTNISIQTAGAGSSQNMPPAIVSVLALVKT